MPRSPKTPPELRTASEHLLYEIEMLNQTAQLLYGSPWAHSDYWADKTVYFAMVESLAAHARSLMSFLHPSGRTKPDDIFARDYIPGWRPPAKWRTFDRDRNRVGTEILHLSFNRPPATSGWNFGELVANINKMLRVFIDDVDAARVRTDFKKHARSALTSPVAGWTSVPTQTFQSMARLIERR